MLLTDSRLFLSYSTSDEIQAYMEKVVDDHNLRDFFKLRHEVVGARWNPETAHWIITIRRNGNDADVFEDWCDVFVNGSGKSGARPEMNLQESRNPTDYKTYRPAQCMEMAGHSWTSKLQGSSTAYCRLGSFRQP